MGLFSRNYLPTAHQLSIFVAVENFLPLLRAAAGGEATHIGQEIAFPTLRSQ
jgi:hypothetical protein